MATVQEWSEIAAGFRFLQTFTVTPASDRERLSAYIRLIALTKDNNAESLACRNYLALGAGEKLIWLLYREVL